MIAMIPFNLNIYSWNLELRLWKNGLLFIKFRKKTCMHAPKRIMT